MVLPVLILGCCSSCRCCCCRLFMSPSSMYCEEVGSLLPASAEDTGWRLLLFLHPNGLRDSLLRDSRRRSSEQLTKRGRSVGRQAQTMAMEFSVMDQDIGIPSLSVPSGPIRAKGQSLYAWKAYHSYMSTNRKRREQRAYKMIANTSRSRSETVQRQRGGLRLR